VVRTETPSSKKKLIIRMNAVSIVAVTRIYFEVENNIVAAVIDVWI